MRVIVTRPEHEAAPWVSGLQAAGHEALAWPLIELSALADPLPLQAAWQNKAQWQAVMLVSAQAVRHFFAARPPAPAQGAMASARYWVTGPGTQRALLEAGVPADQIDAPDGAAAQFDSEALWQRVNAQVRPDAPVLIVRGADASAGMSGSGEAQGQGRDWLGQQLQARGVPVQWLAAYERRCPNWSEDQRRAARVAAHDGSVWLWSSSQALRHLQGLLPDTDWSTARAIVTHPRIGEAATALGFGRVLGVRPVLDEVLASLESLA